MQSNEDWSKTPESLLDYAFDWSEWLNPTDEIKSKETIITPDGLTIKQDSTFNGVHTIWLSGGSLSTKYKITSKITTEDGRQEQASRFIKIMPSK